jgi:hypothetical protein
MNYFNVSLEVETATGVLNNKRSFITSDIRHEFSDKYDDKCNIFDMKRATTCRFVFNDGWDVQSDTVCGAYFFVLMGSQTLAVKRRFHLQESLTKDHGNDDIILLLQV